MYEYVIVVFFLICFIIIIWKNNEEKILKLFKKQKIYIKNIHIAGIYEIAYKLELWKAEIGFRIQAEMKSGKTAVFELIDIRNGGGDVDWEWYEFRFHHWKKEKEENYLVYC